MLSLTLVIISITYYIIYCIYMRCVPFCIGPVSDIPLLYFSE